MAEFFLCQYDESHVINPVMDDYVITNKHEVFDDSSRYRYACAECQRTNAKQLVTA